MHSADFKTASRECGKVFSCSKRGGPNNSKENVALIKGIYDCFAVGGVPGVLSAIRVRVKLFSAPESHDTTLTRSQEQRSSSTFRGRAGWVWILRNDGERRIMKNNLTLTPGDPW